jgi:DNA-directed RNA polymerase subunit M/transcription elongation factor TFIIS
VKERSNQNYERML